MLSIFNTFLHYRIFFLVTWAVIQHLLAFLPLYLSNISTGNLDRRTLEHGVRNKQHELKHSIFSLFHSFTFSLFKPSFHPFNFQLFKLT